jgi:arylsulfatase A-like enzyme
MLRRSFFPTLAGASLIPSLQAAGERPNIIFILADDIGYGDVSCYGATKVQTPNLDKLAARGIRFTDGHSCSATCTPTRYGLMTGQYPWRKKGTNILPGDAALIVEPGSTTLPSMLKSAGYETGVVGKWHLGLGSGSIDWNTEVKPGPREIGFDYSFLVPATGDRTPCVYMENQRVVGLDPKDPIQVSYKEPLTEEPTGRDRPDLLKMKYSRGHDMTIINGISRIGYMSGGKKARWVDEDMADVLAERAVRFIGQKRQKPFFLYFATHDIHVPRVPHKRFQGTSQCGVRCDAIRQFDFQVGSILAALEKNKLTENTLIVLSSDNGPVVDDGYADASVENLNGHEPAGALRGGKYSSYEGGTRVPFVVSWPKRVKAGGVSDALVCQIDLLASFAALTGQSLPAEAAPDSINVLPALLGESKKGRDHLVEHARNLSMRKGQWKLIPKEVAPNVKKKGNGNGGGATELFDLSKDLPEATNVAGQNPQVVAELTALLQRIQDSGRSR